MKNNRKTYFLIAGVVIALGVGAVYGKSSGKFLGSIQMQSTSSPWWCISQEEWDKTHPQYGEGTPGTSVTPGKGKGTATPKAGTPGFYIPGKPEGFNLDKNKPTGTQTKLDPNSSKTGTTIPSWKFIDPSTGTRGSSGIGGTGGNTNTGNGTTAGNNNTGTGPTIPVIPIDPTKIPPKTGNEEPSDTLHFGLQCDCDSLGKDIYISAVGKNLKCPSSYGQQTNYSGTLPTPSNTLTKYNVNLTTPPEGACNPKYFCPTGSITNWEKIIENCNPQKMVYERKCDNKFDNNMAKICTILEGKYFSDNFKAANDANYLCLNTEDCQKYLDLAQKGTFTSTITDKSYNDVMKSCSAKGVVGSI
ncbi:hypothetical protein KBC97_01370 [Candidatus Gracilibacteria bacterium]|nr:hypothetical protein [Candidatus Gracilibacteria bacterium]